MMPVIYPLPPTPAIVFPTVKVSRSWFTDEELDHVVGYGDARILLDGQPARVGTSQHSRFDPTRRVSKLSWFGVADDTAWIFAKLAAQIGEANALFWQFDLAGFCDQLQFSVYEGESGGHFEWHMDMGEDNRAQRKLSFSLLLSNYEDYDGGEFEVMQGGANAIKDKARGTFIVFPSFIQHRVTPVTRGIRRSLVGWVSGPRFR